MTLIVNRTPFNFLAGGQEASMPAFFDDPATWANIGGRFFAGNHQRNWWHFQAPVPPPPPDAGWIIMFTSICGLSIGTSGWEAEIGLGTGAGGGAVYLQRAYSVDSATPQVIGAPINWILTVDGTPDGHGGNTGMGPAIISGPMVLFGTPLGDPAWLDPSNIWEEYWLTEGIGSGDNLGAVSYHTDLLGSVRSSVRLPNQRNGPAVNWLEPGWRSAASGGAAGYFVAPYPQTVDYWFTQQAYTLTGSLAQTLAGLPAPVGNPFNPTTANDLLNNPFELSATWDFPLLELVTIACSPGKTDTTAGWQGVRRRGRLVGCSDLTKLF